MILLMCVISRKR